MGAMDTGFVAERVGEQGLGWGRCDSSSDEELALFL